MKKTVKAFGNSGLHVTLKKTDGFSEGDEVSIGHYDRTKEKSRCEFDIIAIRANVKEVVEEVMSNR